MEIEKPKVQNSNEPNKSTELMILINNVFNNTEDGKKLLATLKNLFVSDKNSALVFPANMQSILSQFGSVETYAGFKAGQCGVIFWIESMIEAYRKMESK